MIDCFYTAHGSAQTLNISQAGDSCFDGYAGWKARCTGRRPQQNSDLVTGFDKVTGEHPADKAGASGEKDHREDYSREFQLRSSNSPNYWFKTVEIRGESARLFNKIANVNPAYMM
jgi:hypothetical protein